MALLRLHSRRWSISQLTKGGEARERRRKGDWSSGWAELQLEKTNRALGCCKSPQKTNFGDSFGVIQRHCCIVIDFFGCCFSIFPLASACASGFSFFHISSIWVSVVHNIAIAPVRKTFSNALRFWILHNLKFFNFVVFRPWDWLSSPTAILQSFLTQN